MPNQSKNPYYLYMIEFRKKQKELGITYANMNEVQKAADPTWRTLPPAQKAKYVNMTKRNKGMKRFLVDEEKEQEMADEAQQQIIKTFIKQKSNTNDLLKEDFFIIDVNSYCYCNFLRQFLIAEFSILRFSVQDGVKDHIHKAINIGAIPMGYGSDVKWSCKELGLEKPDEDQPATNLKALLHYIIKYMKGMEGGPLLPHLYANEEKIPEIESFILQMCTADDEDPTRFSVFKLQSLFYYMNNEIRILSYDRIPRVEVAKKMLTKDNFWYIYSGFGCDNHDDPDLPNRKALECTSSRVHRWAYRILERSCLIACIEPVLGKQLPLKTNAKDFEEINRLIKEKLKEATTVTEDTVEGAWALSEESEGRSNSTAQVEASWNQLRDRMYGLDITEPMSNNYSGAGDPSLCGPVGRTPESEMGPYSEASFNTLPSWYNDVAASESASAYGYGDDESTLGNEFEGACSLASFNSVGGQVSYPGTFSSSFFPTRNDQSARPGSSGFHGVFGDRGRDNQSARPGSSGFHGVFGDRGQDNQSARPDSSGFYGVLGGRGRDDPGARPSCSGLHVVGRGRGKSRKRSPPPCTSTSPDTWDD